MKIDSRRTLTKKEVVWLENYRRYLNQDVLNTISAIDKYYAEQPGVSRITTVVAKARIDKLSDDIDKLVKLRGDKESFIANIYKEITEVTDDIDKVRLDALADIKLADQLQEIKNKHNLDLNTLVKKQSIALKRIESIGSEKKGGGSFPSAEEGIWAGLYAIATPLAVAAKPIYDIFKHFKGKSSMKSVGKNIPEGGIGGGSGDEDEQQFPSHPLSMPEVPTGDIAGSLSAQGTRTYTRRGKQYTQEVDASGKFGKMSSSPGDAETSKKNATDSVKTGLEKFFSTGAFKSKYTVALLDAVKGGSGKKGTDTIINKGKTSIPGLTSVVLPLLAAAAIGTAIGLLAKKAMQHFWGDDIDAANKSLAIAAIDQKTNTEKVKAALPHMTTEEKAKLAYAMNPKNGAPGAKGVPGTNGAIDVTQTSKEVSIATMATGSKDGATETSKDELVIPINTDGSIDPAALSEQVDKAQGALEKIPVDELQADAEKNIKEGLDKLNSSMDSLGETLKEGAKNTSTKLPSGFDANNIRNPLLSSLAAGVLTN